MATKTQIVVTFDANFSTLPLHELIDTFINNLDNQVGKNYGTEITRNPEENYCLFKKADGHNSIEFKCSNFGEFLEKFAKHISKYEMVSTLNGYYDIAEIKAKEVTVVDKE